MIDIVDELEPGEHVDLDGGPMVERLQNGEQFRIDHPDLGYIILEADEIEAVAKLAGVI